MLQLNPVEPKNGTVPCGLCATRATCVLHDSDTSGTSTKMMFFCPKHIRVYLDAHPETLNQLLDRFGNQAVFAFYEL